MVEKADCIVDVDEFTLCAVDGVDGCCQPDIIGQLWDGYVLAVVFG